MTTPQSIPPRMRIAATLMLLAAMQPARLPAQQVADAAARVDAVFAGFTGDTVPGCAVGVAYNGTAPLLRAYGMADLEHGVPNAVNTVFEAGSVSKQFTAAAVILLVLDGRLALDDDVRRYIPELPDYGSTITLRHLLNHTSGLRDWGSVAGISGWGRSERTHTHDHVLDILTRQRALNFVPGAQYSYSNSGYNLLAIVVARVSGESFADFSRTRIFEPLGLTDTHWRDDYTRIVKRRAAAYAVRGGDLVIDRPIENVHGNGGLLTTVTDLLRWNRALDEGQPGGAAFTRLMLETGVLNDGSSIEYAAGLFVTDYRGVPEISHTGATSGYRAFLARYPARSLDVALLCNVGTANPGTLGHRVADVFLGGAPPAPVAVSAAPAAAPQPAAARDPGNTDGNAVTLPESRVLQAITGVYYSPDAEVALSIELHDGRLVAVRRPGTRFPMRFTGRDTFDTGLGTIRVIRDDDGAAVQLSVQQPRVFDIRFDRINNE